MHLLLFIERICYPKNLLNSFVICIYAIIDNALCQRMFKNFCKNKYADHIIFFSFLTEVNWARKNKTLTSINGKL